MTSDTSDELFTEARRLPTECPTCGSENPTTYYGSCFDNQHSTIFDPRLPLDPWHAYMNDLRLLRRNVDNLNAYVKAGRGVRERIEAERDAERAARERAEAEARQLRALTEGDPDSIYHEAAEMRSELMHLRRWKLEATEVIESWELVYEALGDVGGLGQRRSDAVLAEVLRMKAELDRAQLRSIEASNPGIDMNEVRRVRLAYPDPERHETVSRAKYGASLAADLDNRSTE